MFNEKEFKHLYDERESQEIFEATILAAQPVIDQFTGFGFKKDQSIDFYFGMMAGLKLASNLCEMCETIPQVDNHAMNFYMEAIIIANEKLKAQNDAQGSGA